MLCQYEETNNDGLYQLANKRQVSIDYLVQLCCEYSLKHADEIITDDMRDKK